ncbi:MAG: glutathione peroxidase [Pirellulales bacterium]
MVLPASAADEKGPLDFKMKSIDGKDVDLSKYKGDVVLIVNVASKCGLTPQYEQLETVYSKYKDKGLNVLGFPANEFGKQEPGTNDEIAKFCSSKYSVDFPMFAKIVVKGSDIDPLYKFLTSEDTNPGMSGDIKWNFEKFLVGRDGKVIKRFDPRTKPDAPEVIEAIEKELAKK